MTNMTEDQRHERLLRRIKTINTGVEIDLMRATPVYIKLAEGKATSSVLLSSTPDARQILFDYNERGRVIGIEIV